MQTLPQSQGGATAALAEFEHKDQVRGVLRAFLALRHRNFRLFWTGQLISLIGTWMQTTGQAWLVLELTHSAWLLGLVGALQFLPVLILSLFGGVLADRLPKRTVLRFTQSFATLQAFVLWILVATGEVRLWHVLVLASLLGLTNSFDMPTRQAFVVEMVGREDLPNAIALNSSLFNMARILGPGLGGLIIAWLGVAPLFLLNALSFIPVIIGLFLIDNSTLYAQAKRTPRAHSFHPAHYYSHRCGIPVRHQLQCCTAPVRDGCSTCGSRRLRLHLLRLRLRLTLLSALAGLE